MQKNKEWYEIFENMFFVVKKKWVDSTKAILAFILLIDKIQELKWTKAEKALYVILKNKPALFWKLLKWFYDDVEKLKDIEKSKEVVEKSKEVVKKSKEKWVVFIEIKEITNEQIKQTAKRLKSMVHKKASQYEGKINNLTQWIQQKYNVNPYEAYLIAFRYFGRYSKNRFR